MNAHDYDQHLDDGTMTPTEELANHASSLRWETLSAEVRDRTQVIFKDTVGVLLGSSHTAAISTLVEARAKRRGPSEATVVGWPDLDSLEQAAFVNGVGGHQIELDDSHGASLAHPAAVLVPAVLAAGEYAGASGADVLVGLVVGYDVLGRVAKAMGALNQYHRGFHPSSVCGTIGAAAAAGRIMGLTPAQMRICLGHASSQASGLLIWEDDPSHLTKSFQTGIAARNGIHAALVAEAGFGGAEDSLAGRYDALKAFGGPKSDPAPLTAELGVMFEIMETDLKRYSSCRHTHAPIDGLLELMRATDIRAADIEEIDVKISTSAVHVVDANPLWTHNVQYVLGVAAVAGDVLYEHFEPEWTTNPEVLNIASKVRFSGSDDLERAFPAAKGALVAVRTATGTTSTKVAYPMGHRNNPIPDDVLDEKFAVLAAQGIPAEAVDALREVLMNFPSQPDLADLTRLLRLGNAAN